MTEPLSAEEVEQALFDLRSCTLPSCAPCDHRFVRLVATYDALTARAEAAEARNAKLLAVVEAAQAWDEAAAHFDSIDEETNGGAGFEGAARFTMAAVGANAAEGAYVAALAALIEEGK